MSKWLCQFCRAINYDLSRPLIEALAALARTEKKP
jgi:hypothetical protein